MGKKITALEFQKRNKRRVNVHLDGSFAFGLADIEAARLRVGQELSEEEIAHLQQRDAVEVALQKAMGLLSYRPRSKNELRARLRSKFTEETISETLERLEHIGLANDLEFARYWIENRFQFNPRGVMALRQELGQKGVDRAIVDKALADYDEQDAAARAAAKGARKLQGLEREAFERKLNDYLLRRGFSYSLVKPLVERITDERASEEPWKGEE